MADIKKNPWRFLFLAAAILSGSCLAVYGAALLWAKQLTKTPPASIGIIGGADGPTAVFVATSGSAWDLWVLVGMLIIGIVGYLWLKNKKT